MIYNPAIVGNSGASSFSGLWDYIRNNGTFVKDPVSIADPINFESEKYMVFVILCTDDSGSPGSSVLYATPIEPGRTFYSLGGLFKERTIVININYGYITIGEPDGAEAIKDMVMTLGNYTAEKKITGLYYLVEPL